MMATGRMIRGSSRSAAIAGNLGLRTFRSWGRVLFRMKTPALLGIVLAMFASLAFAQDAPPAQTPLKPLPPDGFVTLAQIVGEFTSSPDAALKKYDGMRILVYGRVGQVRQSDDSNSDPLAVIMQLPSQATPDVRALFSADDIPTTNMTVANDHSQAAVFHRNWEGVLTSERSFVAVGQNVGIRGTYDNFIAGEIVLKNCSKLSPATMLGKLREHGIPTE